MEKIENILKNTTHKDSFKSTTTLKFKKDLVDILLNKSFKGDVLEVGSNRGHTSVVLAAVCEKLGKKFFGFEYQQELIDKSNALCKSFDVECNFIQKDVYKDSWNLKNIGFIFIDCMHTEKCFSIDLKNSFNLLNKNGMVAVHDYGLVTLQGQKISNIVNTNLDKYKIIKYIGEEKDWNKTGSGSVIDWEGVVLCRRTT